jgi:hypothetical protein
MQHSRGGFYMCKRELLEKMDKQYGHFTFAMGHNGDIDGVACGEIAFASKTRYLGYSYGTLPAAKIAPQPERRRNR